MMLRKATAEDIPAMHRIRVAVRENALSSPDRITPANYEDALARGRGWVVSDDTDPSSSIRGFAFGLNDGNAWALFVDPEHEGQGYGSELHDAMLDWLVFNAERPIWLTTGVGTRAERFYRSRHWVDRGLTPSGERRFERPID